MTTKIASSMMASKSPTDKQMGETSAVSIIGERTTHKMIRADCDDSDTRTVTKHNGLPPHPSEADVRTTSRQPSDYGQNEISHQRINDKIHSSRSLSAARAPLGPSEQKDQRRSSSPTTVSSANSSYRSTRHDCDGSSSLSSSSTKSLNICKTTVTLCGGQAPSNQRAGPRETNTRTDEPMVTRGKPIPANKKCFWGEEKNADSIYSIYLKKISYTFNQSMPSASTSCLVSPNLNDQQESKGTKPAHQGRVRKNFFGYKSKARSSSFDKNSFSPSAAETKALHRRDLSTGRVKAAHKISSDLLDPDRNVHIKSASFNRDEDAQSSGSGGAQCLQWETRKIRVLQAATLSHVVEFILLINSSGQSRHASEARTKLSSSALEDERNNVAHIIHVLFCTYRVYTTPLDLLLKLLHHAGDSCIEQFRFVMHYWMDNYPEDLDYKIGSNQSSATMAWPNKTMSSNANKSDTTCHSSSVSTSEETSLSSNESLQPVNTGSITPLNHNGHVSSSGTSTISSDTSQHDSLLIGVLLNKCKDATICRKALNIVELRQEMSGYDIDRQEQSPNILRQFAAPLSVSKSASVLDLDSRFVAQQLTAIDLEKFLSLRPYLLLEGTKSESVQAMIRNFNLLSRHVIVTILRSHSPHTVASHWIAIAMNLRKIKNFNSLKAIIAGLTNESIYRLKQTVWSRISRTNMANFKMLSSIVDDVNNQTVLRQTQLIIEGTAKLSVEDDSFGTIPYLGTFLTDLNMIDARYQNFIESPQVIDTVTVDDKKIKLINFEKCSKQFEILTQVQLLQKNVIASLYAIQRRNHFDRFANLSNLKSELTRSQHMLLTRPAVPQVARVFRTWFQDTEVSSMTDKQCYAISLTLEQSIPMK